MESVKIGIREFRENLASFLEAETPVAITRHGETLGLYIPVRRNRRKSDMEALKRAGKHIDALIAAAGTEADVLVQDFNSLRRRARRPKR